MDNLKVGLQGEMFLIPKNLIVQAVSEIQVFEAATHKNNWYLCITQEGPVAAYSIISGLAVFGVNRGVLVEVAGRRFVVLADEWLEEDDTPDTPLLDLGQVLEN